MRTTIYPYHEKHSKKIVDFFGWELPLQFTSVIAEHEAVHCASGLFDVSHMGKTVLAVSAPDLSYITVSDLPTRSNLCKYTHVVDPQGRILDDVIFTCLGSNRYLCVGNAARAEPLLKRFMSCFDQGRVVDITPQLTCLAIQGPQSPEVLQAILQTLITDLRPFHGSVANLDADRVKIPVEIQGWDSLSRLLGLGEEGASVYVTRTGYTGEDGFEVFAVSDLGLPIWSALLAAVGDFSVVPAGLGARDTLRLEKGYLLSGQDFDGRQTTLEAGYEWLIDWDHDFAGKHLLLQLRERDDYARFMGVKVLDGAIPRRGSMVYKEGRLIGVLTSATFSPCLRAGIGLGYLGVEAAETGREVEVDIRHRRHPAEVVKTPFVKRRSS